MSDSIHHNIVIWLTSIVTSTIFSLCATTRNKLDIPPHSTAKSPLCILKTIPTFCEFSQEYKPNKHLKNDKWALIASVLLKSKVSLQLEQLTLQWRGKHLQGLNASLYTKRETDKQLIPIEDNLICDGDWHEKEQRLIFHPDKKITAVDELFLVLSYPKGLEPHLKEGKFVFPNRKSAKLLPIR